MVDLGGYVIILVETHDKRVKLYGKLIHSIQISPSNAERNTEYCSAIHFAFLNL